MRTLAMKPLPVITAATTARASVSYRKSRDRYVVLYRGKIVHEAFDRDAALAAARNLNAAVDRTIRLELQGRFMGLDTYHVTRNGGWLGAAYRSPNTGNYSSPLVPDFFGSKAGLLAALKVKINGNSRFRPAT